MKKEELDRILELHRKWVNGEEGGVRANLRDDCLHGADLRYANLYNAKLRHANLCGANLRGADLCGANLRDANLYYADLRYANLYNANLCDADLYEANLCDANLCDSDLREADLYGTDLRGANLRGADLRGAKNIPFIPYACPDTGSFIGYKKASGYIVKLEILEDARRCSATSRKCRCDKAKVLDIQNINGSSANVKSIPSSYDENFIYEIGKIVTEPNFNEDRWEECSAGIHFFINRQEAVDYEN